MPAANAFKRMPLPRIEDVAEWSGKIVLVRVDFNVPLEKGRVKDDFKITETIPTIRYLSQRRAKIILVSHLGRPNGRREPTLSLQPIARHLERLLRRSVVFFDHSLTHASSWTRDVRASIEALRPGSVMMLENIRFSPDEDNDQGSLARLLATCADVFVLDGFGVVHRKAASVTGITRYLPSYAGLLLAREVAGLEHVLSNPKRPLVLVLGGAKAESKIPLLKQFAQRAEIIVLGGTVMSVYLAATGFSVGGSLPDRNVGKKLLALLKRTRVVLPLDVVVGKADGRDARVMEINEDFAITKADEIIYDVGPKTIKLFGTVLNTARTIVWNGALGRFEVAAYRAGTFALARLLGKQGKAGAHVIAGGGETAQIIRSLRLAKHYTLVSTGGGAMLEFLSARRDLPGIAALKKSALRQKNKHA